MPASHSRPPSRSRTLRSRRPSRDARHAAAAALKKDALVEPGLAQGSQLPRNRSPIGKKKFILSRSSLPTRRPAGSSVTPTTSRSPGSTALHCSRAGVQVECVRVGGAGDQAPAEQRPRARRAVRSHARHPHSTRPTRPVHLRGSRCSRTQGAARPSPSRLAKEVDPACPIHAYEATTTSLKMRPSTCQFVSPRHTAEASGPAVHAYSTPKSTLKTSGAAAFSMEKRDGKSTMRSLAPVHSYGGLTSTLSKGGASFGTSARSSLPTLTRTGLVTAAVTPSAARSVPTSLPPLVPKVSVVEAIKEGGETPLTRRGD